MRFKSFWRIDIAPLSITRLSGMEGRWKSDLRWLHGIRFAQFRPLKAMAEGISPRRRYADEVDFIYQRKLLIASLTLSVR